MHWHTGRGLGSLEQGWIGTQAEVWAILNRGGLAHRPRLVQCSKVWTGTQAEAWTVLKKHGFAHRPRLGLRGTAVDAHTSWGLGRAEHW